MNFNPSSKQSSMRENNPTPKPGEIFQHYKGGQYEIVAMCNHTDTDEVLVIYKSLSFGGFHARPYSEWHDEMGRSDISRKRIFRFEKINL